MNLRVFWIVLCCLGIEPIVAQQSVGAVFARALLGEKGGNRFFYFPTADEPSTPKDFGYRYESVFFKSKDGTKLHGWFLPSVLGEKEAKGTVVFSHGNAGSLAYHFVFVNWMVKEGYNVWMYDYRGYGKSEGRISRKGGIEDVTAAFNYLKTRKNTDANKLISFGHSLGGAKSIVALAQTRQTGVRGIAVMGAFASYRDIAIERAGKLAAATVTDEFASEDWVGKLEACPLLVIHGVKDTVVPYAHGVRLFQRAKQPKTAIYVPEGGHNDTIYGANEVFARKLLDWMEQVLEVK